MCLLSFYPAGAVVDTDHLCNGSETNPDGFGCAIVTPNGIKSFKSMVFAEVLATFLRWRTDYPLGDALFHSRITTHGLTSWENCHPYPIGRDGRYPTTVIGHNGVLPYAAQPYKGDPRSDTRIFAEEIFLPKFKDLDSRKTIDRLERWLTPYNKLVILTVNPYYRKHSYILNENSGTWVAGVWHSNSSYLKREYTVWAYSGTGYTYSPKRAKDEPLRYSSDCLLCESRDCIQWGICTICFTCKYCELDSDECTCFAQSSASSTYYSEGRRAITAAPGIHSQPLDVDVTADAVYCDWCSEETSVCACVGASARADVEARAADVGMSEAEMDAHWERLMADYDLKNAASSNGTEIGR